jgi:TonB-dependent receptor
VFNDNVDRTFIQQTFSNLDDPTPLTNGRFDQPPSVTFPYENHPIEESVYDVGYTGFQRIGAVYAMADIPVGEQFNVIGGVRIESTTLRTVVTGEAGATYFLPGALVPISLPLNPGGADANFSPNDVLPAIGLQWQAREDVVVRLNFAQTIARQTFRELTPILQQEYIGGPIFIGNPDLLMSSLNNFDVRVDYTPAEGWLFSASAFHKSVNDAIEYAQFVTAGNWRYTAPVNYPTGKMTGVELEVRLKMGELDERLQGLGFGANATLIRSQVTLPADEAADFAAAGYPLTTRDMTATPQYLLNLNSTYDIAESGTQLGLFYNIQGDTLVAGDGVSGVAFIPAVYALPYGTLNFTIQQSIGEHWKIFFQAKNILNPEIQSVYRSQYLPSDILYTSYTAGVDFAIGASFQMNF